MATTPNPLLSLITAGITLYQRTLSPDHGPLRYAFPVGVCRYTPTCSEFMVDAIHQQGWRGLRLGLRRLLSCHPYSKR